MKARFTVLAILVACGPSGGSEQDSTDATGSETTSTQTSSSDSTTSQADSTSTSGDVDLGCDEMVEIPAGSFWMGCNEATDSQCYPDELPYHEVTLDAFAIDRCEVDAASYAECIAAGACLNNEVADLASCYHPRGGDGELAVNCIQWADAEAYCGWVGKQLPTEAQWEKAARGTDGRIYPWGDELPTCDLAVMHVVPELSGCDEGRGAAPGSRPAGVSPYGLFDMAGNMGEWVADDYAAEYYAESPSGNPTGPDPTPGADKIVRGGGWGYDASSGFLRASARVRLAPDAGHIVNGFRCVAP